MRFIGALALCALVSSATAEPTRTVDVVDTYHGTRVRDPYRWLEDAESDEVRQWTQAQNARLRTHIDGLPDRDRIRSKLAALYNNGTGRFHSFAARGERIFAKLNDPKQQQPLLIVFDRRLDPAAARVVIDPNRLDPQGNTSIDWFNASPDGRRVAVSLSRNGSEFGTLRVYTVDGGAKLGSEIPGVNAPTGGGSVAWAHDSSGFWYTRYPGKERPAEERQLYQQVYFHRLGSDWRRDRLVLGTKDGVPRIGAIILDSRNLRGRTLARVGIGESWEFSHFLLTPQRAQKLADFSDQVLTIAAGPDGALYAMSREAALSGKILRVPRPFAPLAVRTAPVIIPPSDTAIESLTVTRTGLLVTDIVGGTNRIRSFDHRGGFRGLLPVPDMAAVGSIEPLPDGSALFFVSTYLRPSYVVRWDRAAGLEKQQALATTVPYAFGDSEVVREFAVSKDGTRVPVDIIRKKGMALDGSNPAILYGYGGFGDSEKPSFAGAFIRMWLDAGGIYATAMIRGGGEFGERWHQDGYLTKKQNGFDDFAATARHLIDRGYTSSAKLALSGQSNGGLLVGAVLTQHPALAAAAVARVGIFDSLRMELDPNGEFNVTEFGTVAERAQFAAMHAYSPYHRVSAGVRYPAVLLTAGENDGRVSPMHARKFAAALQDATASEAPILLRTSAAGHGIGTAQDELNEEDADVLAFLMHQLGVGLPGATERPESKP
jgi:prolyl oligopeptidase